MAKYSDAVAAVITTAVMSALWHMGGKLLRAYFVHRYTIIKDLPGAGKARSDEERICGTAVICGGSISGLWAARICADHFENVLIVEPEAWLATPDGGMPVYDRNGEQIESTPAHTRTRVYQYNASHSFPIMLLKALRHVFPNFDEELCKRDGRIQEPYYNINTCTGPFFRAHAAVSKSGDCNEGFFCSRDAFERLLRTLVLKYSKRIRCIAGVACGVETVVEDAKRIETVTVNLTGGGNLSIPAALVIDCTGGTQAGLKWIKKLHAKTLESEVLDGEVSSKIQTMWNEVTVSYNVNTRLKSFIFRVPPHIRNTLPIPGGYDKAAWLYAFIPIPGLEKKAFFIHKVDGHRIRYSFYGWGDPPIPEDYNDIKDYMSQLNTDNPVPTWIAAMTDLLLDYKDDASSMTYRLPPLSRIKFEDAPLLPSNFIAIGDAVMRVNPTFGQGCTKACIGAITLDSVLRSRAMLHKRDIPKNFSLRFFDSHRNKTIDAWDGTKPMDYMFDTTTPIKGEKLSDERFKGFLSVLLMEMAVKDLEIDALLVHVRQFTAPATDICAPWVLWRICVFLLKRKTSSK